MESMNDRQKHFVQLLYADLRRDIYMGCDHQYWVTYTGDEPRYKPLTQQEVEQMMTLGLINERWPGCYTLPSNLLASRNG
jgi:hypothetical protein